MKSGEVSKASIVIAGKEFPLKLSAEEQERLPLIEEEINNKIHQYQSNFKTMSQQDAITMVLISYAFELQNSKDDNTKELLSQTLSELESSLGI